MDNRRNYYRILQVQPGCPTEVIRSSYQTLMQKLKIHPDLGGDHEQAALLNEAYSVLSNPKKRAIYDTKYKLFIDDMRKSSIKMSDQLEETVAKVYLSKQCLFCKTSNPSVAVERMIWCRTCDSPLIFTFKDEEPFESINDRSLDRIKMSEDLYYFVSYPGSANKAHLLDLSPRGLKMVSLSRLELNQIIKLNSSLFKAIGVVKHILPYWLYQYEIGVEFKTIKFLKNNGNFLTMQV